MSMERSRSQVMFQFLPGNTFDYSDSRGIWRVSYLETSSIGGEIDRQYILARIRHRVENWDGGYLGFDTWQPDFYHFGRPEGVRASPFPLTYRCTRCEHAHQYYGVDDLEDENSDLTCERSGCNGQLKQYQFVSVHTCGKIEGLNVPSCQNGHGRKHIELDTRGSQKASKFRWRCRVGDCQWSAPIAWFQNCDCDYEQPSDEEGETDDSDEDSGDSMYTTVHRAGSVFYPHYLTTVNLRTAGLGRLRNSADGIYRGIAKYFELAPTEVEVEDIDLSEETSPGEIDENRAAEIMVANDDINSFQEARNYLRKQGEIDSQTLRGRIDELLAFDRDDEENQLDAAGDELLQYVLSRQELTTHSLPDLEETARQRGFPAKADRIRAYQDDLDRLGFDDVHVIEDFPIQTFVYGYTRGSRNNARIQPFSANNSDGEGTPIFVDTAETEGVQFDLDPAEVLLWLACNFPEATDETIVKGDITLPDVDPQSADSIQRARSEIEEMGRDAQRAFIINHLGGVDDYGRFDTDTEDTIAGDITAATFQLLHTTSHILLKQASTISGFDRTNLSEFLFPRSLSVVIYANNRDEFNMGGMNTMVEQQLDTLLGQAETVGNDCVYDPVCSQRGGSCLSCLHVSEISCSFFNQVLARDYLFGSRPSSPMNLIGYWDVTPK